MEHQSEISETELKRESLAGVLPLMTRFWLWLLGGMFDKVKFFKKNVAAIKKHLSQGAVIHVFQFSSYLEYLIFTHFLIKNGLPPVLYPNENWLMGLFTRMVGWFSRKNKAFKRRVHKSVLPGEQYVIFLQNKGSFLSLRSQRKIDELRRLLDLQKECDTPIFLMPQITIWSKRPVSMIRSIWDIFFGNSLKPGRLRKIIIFLRHYKSAFVRSGQPLRLDDWTSDVFEQHGKNPIQEIRWRLFHFFTEEREAVTGPMTKPRTWILESVINSDAVQDVISQIAAEEDVPVRKIQARAAKELEFLAADYRFTFIIMASYLMRVSTGRMFSKIKLDPKGLELVREQLKQNAVVYVPSHKSYMDFLLWSWLMYENGIVAPHIIAGENMAFWPMGFLFRRMGAIFIRRSFKDNRLYSVILRQYLIRMLWEGYSQEFFIEGTRSRSGKMLHPKFGILSIYVDAYLRNPRRDITFIPISINYNKLIEEQSHGKESAGGEKKKESTSGLLKVFDVFRLNYGAVYLQVGKPISLHDYVQERGHTPEQISDKQRRSLIQMLGYELVHRINESMTVTPSAVVGLALLTAGRKGVEEKHLQRVVEFILHYLKEFGAILAPSLEHADWTMHETLDLLRTEGSIETHLVADETVYVLNENHRLRLDYYKNHILHYFVPTSIVALAFSSLGKERVSVEEVKRRAKGLDEIFDFEIIHSPKESFNLQFEHACELLTSHGILAIEEDEFVKTEKTDKNLHLFGRLISNFLESYWVVASSLHYLVEKRLSEKKFLKIVLDEGKKMVLIGALERGEAYSKNNFQNALKYFQHRGVLISDVQYDDTVVVKVQRKLLVNRKKAEKMMKKRKLYLELAHEHNNKQAVESIARNIRSYLTRDPDQI